MKHVLIHSGGGVKGAIPLWTLNKIEKEMRVVEGEKRLCEYYDLCVGSSVGAINSAYLASGKYSTDDLITTYPLLVKKVFKKIFFLKTPKYDRKNFVLAWLDLFGLIKLKDVKTKLSIVSVDMCENRNHFFKSWEETDGNEYLHEIICRSFAAPYFFGLLPDYKNLKVWSDGGTGYANLPIDIAIVETILLGWFNEDICFDIIGTGFVNETKSFNDLKNDGLISQIFGFMKPTDGGLARAQSRMDQIGKINIIAENLKNIHYRYWDVQIDEKDDKMDAVELVEKYMEYGKKMAETPLMEK